jgi:hypothetical protein
VSQSLSVRVSEAFGGHKFANHTMGETEESHLERQGSVESYEQVKGPTFNIPRVSARTLVGAASPANIGALEWGSQGLLAYGSNCSVVVIDTRNVQTVQTLEKHKHPVQKVGVSNDYI